MNRSDEGRFATISRSSSLSTEATSRRGSFLIINSISRDSCVDLDGRISVGDRLLFVNDRKLTRATLGEAANALHNAPLGYTMIGVAKMTLVPPPPTIASSPQFTALVSSPDDSTTMQVNNPAKLNEILMYSTFRLILLVFSLHFPLYPLLFGMRIMANAVGCLFVDKPHPLHGSRLCVCNSFTAPLLSIGGDQSG